MNRCERRGGGEKIKGGERNKHSSKEKGKGQKVKDVSLNLQKRPSTAKEKRYTIKEGANKKKELIKKSELKRGELLRHTTYVPTSVGDQSYSYSKEGRLNVRGRTNWMV